MRREKDQQTETHRIPNKEFVYPGGDRMCRDGQARAAWWARKLQNGEIEEGDIGRLSEKADFALNRGASTNKRNLIARIVHWLFRTNQIDDYTVNGSFLSNGNTYNVDDERFTRLRNQLEEYDKTHLGR